MDIIGVFLNLIADIDIYIKVLPNWEINKEILKNTPKQAYKLLKALYSLKQVPQLQQKELASTLQQLGFKAYTSNQYIYINKLTEILIVIYINNILIIGKDKVKIKALKRSLTRRFKMEDLGPVKYFIGVRIT